MDSDFGHIFEDQTNKNLLKFSNLYESRKIKEFALKIDG